MDVVNSYCPYIKFKPKVWSALAQGEAEGQSRPDHLLYPILGIEPNMASASL